MIPYVKGRVTRQAHVAVPEGTVEEEYAREGFFGRYAHLYRERPPVNWASIEGPLRPRAYDFARAAGKRGDYLAEREPILGNEDVAISFARLDQAMPYYFRNADGDEVFFVHAGGGTLETDFGPLRYVPGDYLVVPRGVVHRWVPDSGQGTTEILACQARGEVGWPDKGMLGQHAILDPAMIRVPEPAPVPSDAPCEVRILREGQVTRVTYPHPPIDVVGWKGTLTVWQVNVRDLRPVLSDRYHLPPSAHSTFVAPGFVICTFLPRPLENGDAEAMKVPFYHSNIDYDEFLFYHAGEFFSRKGIRPGMATFHPQGIPHGPQPGARERTAELKRTEEVAVMIDTRRPLRRLARADALELNDYWRSWQK